MASAGQYDGFGDIGKALKSTALVSAIATLVMPLGTGGTFLIMGMMVYGASSYLGYSSLGYTSFARGASIASYGIIGGLACLFFLASLVYRIRTFKALKDIGERHNNADITALGKHWFVELIMTVITAPLYVVTAIVTLVAYYNLVYFPYTPFPSWHPVLLLCNWFAMVLTGMYTMVDGFKKWEPVGQMFTSYKGKAGMEFLRKSQGTGFAIFIISHYAMIYLLFMASTWGMLSGMSYSPLQSMGSMLTGILFPVGVATAIMTLVASVNQVKGLFRVGNALIDLEEGRVSASPYGGSSPYHSQAMPYGAPSTYGGPIPYIAPAGSGGYQQGSWNAPRYSQALQPMQPVEMAPSSPAGYRDTSALDAGWNIDTRSAAKPAPAGGARLCKNCQAALPPNDDVAFCPYCGASV